MEFNELLENENFELTGSVTADIEASLIARYSKYTYKEKTEKLLQIKNKCSKKIQEGIELYINNIGNVLNKMDDLLKDGFYLIAAKELQNISTFLYPETFNNIKDCLALGRNNYYILVKMNESGQNTSDGYGCITKIDNELKHAYINFKMLDRKYESKINPLYNLDIPLENKFQRFDIVRVPYSYGYVIVVGKEDVEFEIERPLDRGSIKTDFYFCRPPTGWDYNKPYYYEHVTSLEAINYQFLKVDYEDAPAFIRELHDVIKNKYLTKKGCF